MIKYSLIIPAFNEEDTIKEVIERAKPFVDEIIVADDNSTDNTAKIAEENGAIVILNSGPKGYEPNINNAIKYASGDAIITIDADLEHKPEDIPLFKEKIKQGNDIVIGKRKNIPRKGEIMLSNLTKEHFQIEDVLCGFRAFKKEILSEIDYSGKGYFGLDFILKSVKKSKKIIQIEISEMNLREDKPRVGENSEVEELLLKIIKYVIETYLKS